MKRLFAFLFVATLLVSGCSKEYDDTKVWDSIDSLKQQVSAMETVIRAYENKLFIESVTQTDNGYEIIFSDNSKVTITNGKDGADGIDGKDGQDGTDGIDGKDGDTHIASITIKDDCVSFTLTDGASFSIPLHTALSIDFDTTDLLVIEANSTRDIHYTIQSVTTDINVEVISSADIKAVVIPDTNNKGSIRIHTGAKIDEYSKIVVFVSDGQKVIMRSILFEEAGLIIDDNSTKQVSAEGGCITLDFLTNVECKAVIPDEAQFWISAAPIARSLEQRSITLKIEPNTTYNRHTTVTIQSAENTLKLEYHIEQSGNLGANPDELPQYPSICILGASMAFPDNTWFEMACESLNTQGINKARGNGTRIGDDALDWAEERLFEEGELDCFDVLAIMHCHEAEVCNEAKLLANYNDYTLAASMDYSQGFDYVIRRYIDTCRALEFDRSSKWFGIEGGKPVKIILCTYWHDARVVYNESIRQLAEKWSDYTTICEFDKNIGFTKDKPDPITGEQISIRYAKNGFGDTEVLYGITYGWHPTRGRNSEIQQHMAEIFADVVKTIVK